MMAVSLSQWEKSGSLARLGGENFVYLFPKHVFLVLRVNLAYRSIFGRQTAQSRAQTDVDRATVNGGSLV